MVSISLRALGLTITLLLAYHFGRWIGIDLFGWSPP